MEHDTRSALDRGYPIALEALDLEIYQLTSVFAASPALARLGKVYSYPERLRSTFEQSEASRRLIALAATLRSFMDGWSVKKRHAIDKGAGPVGLLIPDTQAPKKRERLLFREACNKFIHAEHINFDLGIINFDGYPPLRPTVYVYGTKSSKSWKATVKVFEFLRVASGIGK